MSQESILIKALEDEIKRFKGIFKEGAKVTIDKEVSNYPVFVAHQDEIPLGVEFVNREKSGTFWSYNVTTLEELVTKKIINTDRLDNFKRIYKDPLKFICVFVVEQKGASFVFYPYND